MLNEILFHICKFARIEFREVLAERLFRGILDDKNNLRKPQSIAKLLGSVS